jgi:hypothetical protein
MTCCRTALGAIQPIGKKQFLVMLTRGGCAVRGTTQDLNHRVYKTHRL